MSTDLEQFYGVFFEEAGELLAEMENRLLGLDVSAPSLEDLNAIFRAAHSIKGGAGTFGFNDMTGMTHILETLLDRLRKQELVLRSEMVDVFLQAGDVLKNQLSGHRGDGEADPEVTKQVCARLEKLSAGDAASNPVKAVPEAAADESAVLVEADVEETAPEEVVGTAYRIHFPSQDISKKVMDALLADLCRRGDLVNMSTATDCILQLATGDTEEDIWDALAFLVDPGTLDIRKMDAVAQEVPSAVNELVAVAEVAVEPVTAPPPAAEKAGVEKEDPAQAKGYGFFKGAPAAPDGDCKPRENAGGAAGSVTGGTDIPKAVRKDDKAAHAASSSENSSIRVSVEKVDQLINLVGELVIIQAMLAQTASQVDPVIYEKLLEGMSILERNTRDMQESVMSIRMMPISFVFSRFPRVVRDVASKLNKQVELITVGEGTELDRGLIEKIADPLTHLVRNSLDHGIESPEKRIAAGKPAKGIITLRARHQGGNIIIDVSDDGAGLNREKILAKARERGLPVNDNMPDQEVWMLIFEAGFSTAEVITDVSGRGVGMDVVKRNIQSMGGRVEIESVMGAGTRISIRLPLTLAILDGMSVSVGKEIFIIPLTFIIESLQPNKEDIKTISGQGTVVHVRGEYLPLIPLYKVLRIQPGVTDYGCGIILIVESEGAKSAIFIDNLIGQHQVVIKSLETNYRRVTGVSGATIMGDGKVALILDVEAILQMARREDVRQAA